MRKQQRRKWTILPWGWASAQLRTSSAWLWLLLALWLCCCEQIESALLFLVFVTYQHSLELAPSTLENLSFAQVLSVHFPDSDAGLLLPINFLCSTFHFIISPELWHTWLKFPKFFHGILPVNSSIIFHLKLSIYRERQGFLYCRVLSSLKSLISLDMLHNRKQMYKLL